MGGLINQRKGHEAFKRSSLTHVPKYLIENTLANDKHAYAVDIFYCWILDHALTQHSQRQGVTLEITLRQDKREFSERRIFCVKPAAKK